MRTSRTTAGFAREGWQSSREGWRLSREHRVLDLGPGPGSVGRRLIDADHSPAASTSDTARSVASAAVSPNT